MLQSHCGQVRHHRQAQLPVFVHEGGATWWGNHFSDRRMELERLVWFPVSVGAGGGHQYNIT